MEAASIRAERAGDADAARRLHEEAFAPSHVEARLVDELRASGSIVPELSLVAVDGDELVGHVVYSRASLASGHEVLALAPMAVVPSRQRQGVGTRLVEESLVRARTTQFALVVVMGHPAYYPRFAFEPAGEMGIESPWPSPPEAWMALPLPAYEPSARGLVTYADAFDSG